MPEQDRKDDLICGIPYETFLEWEEREIEEMRKEWAEEEAWKIEEENQRKKGGE